MKDTCIFYRDFRNAAKSLPAEQRAAFYDMILDYAMDEIAPPPDSPFTMPFELIRLRLDQDLAKYTAKSENGKKGGAPKGNSNAQKQPKSTENKLKQPKSSKTSHNVYVNVNDNVNVDVNDNVYVPPNGGNAPAGAPAQTNSKFIKPTLDDIVTYCTENGYSIDAERFYNYYEANGWRVGRSAMKNWRAAVTNWAKNESGYIRSKRQQAHGGSGILDEMNELYAIYQNNETRSD